MALTDISAAKTRLSRAKLLAATLFVALGVALALPLVRVHAQDAPHTSDAAVQLVTGMMNNENAAVLHKDACSYRSKERSERTGGHLWTEKVVETKLGKIRMLIAEDGQPLSAERTAEERGRLAAIVADPSAFIRKAQVAKDDEAHARDLLALASKAFLFSEPQSQGPYVRIEYRPNPDFETQTMEQRVLHAMSGTIVIDPQALRLRYVDGHLPQDVEIGFGILATVRAGSSFSTTRDHFNAPEWKTTQLDTAINGRVMFFRSIAKNEHAEHSDFARVPDDLTIAQAVALAEQP